MRLAIVVGHIDKAKGAHMRAPFNFISEYEYNKMLAALILRYASIRNIECKVFFRDDIGINGAYENVKLFMPIGVIELHFNSHEDPQASGSEVLFGGIDNSQDFAKHVHDQICTVLKRDQKQNRGIKPILPLQRGGASLNNSSHIPSILIEPFFGSNAQDLALALDNIHHLADAIINGFMYWHVANPNSDVDVH